MRALVEQHAAALAGPSGSPGARGIISIVAEPIGDDPVDAYDVAEFAGVDELFEFVVVGVGSLVEHCGEAEFLVFIGGDEFFAVGLVDGDRFFDEDVQAGFKGCDAYSCMGVVGGGDEDRVT